MQLTTTATARPTRVATTTATYIATRHSRWLKVLRAQSPRSRATARRSTAMTALTPTKPSIRVRPSCATAPMRTATARLMRRSSSVRIVQAAKANAWWLVKPPRARRTDFPSSAMRPRKPRAPKCATGWTMTATAWRIRAATTTPTATVTRL